jgi:hypothetical protein
MTGTTKTVLIVAGVGVGAYVLLQLLKPSGAKTVAPARTSLPSDVAFVSGLLQFGRSIFGETAPTNGPNQYGNAAPGSFTPYAPGATSPGPFAPFDPNSEIDPSTGGVELDPGETYGPPAPGGLN